MDHALGYLAYALDRAPTGIGQYTQRLLQAFQRPGFSPLVLQSGGGATGCPTVRLPGASLLPALLTLGQAEIGWYARRHALALVHDPTGTAPLALCPAQRVVTIHDVFPLSFPGHSTALETLIYRFWLPFAVRQVDAVLTDSAQSQIGYQQLSPGAGRKNQRDPVSRRCPFPPAAGRSKLPRSSPARASPARTSCTSARWSRARTCCACWRPTPCCARRLPAVRLVIVGARNYWKSSPVAAGRAGTRA